MKTYKDFNIASSIESYRLQTEPDLAAAVSMAINVLLSSVRNVEHLSTEDWSPDTLKLRTKGLTLLEGLHPETARSMTMRRSRTLWRS